MKPEDQVAPLTLAQRMKELGFPQDTPLAWDVNKELQWRGYLPLWYHPERGQEPIELLCAAPTVAEILDLLPPDHHLMLRGRSFLSRYNCFADGENLIGTYGSTAAEAVALRWIALAEAGALRPA